VPRAFVFRMPHATARRESAKVRAERSRMVQPVTTRMTAWRRAVAVYGQRRMLVMLLLGFSSGLPLALTGSTLQAWLTESRVSIADIGLFSLVAIPYTWKFVWAPVLDGIAVPGLSHVLGHRRAWLLVIQIALLAAVASLSVVDPAEDLLPVALVALLIAFLSASQDTVVDAFRIESLPESEQAAGSASFVAAYRMAMFVSFTGAVAVVSITESLGTTAQEAWKVGYLVMAGLVLVGVLGTLLAREDWAAQAGQFQRSWHERIEASVVKPFRDFFSKEFWLPILAFVVLFKLGDSFTSELRTSFFLTHGFERAAYAGIQWPFALFPVIIGGFFGGILASRYGLMRALWIAGLAQMATNLIFIWPAVVLPGLVEAIGVPDAAGIKRLTIAALASGGWASWQASAALAGSVAIENFATGLGATIFVAYLSKLCSNREYTATQYALLTSLAAQTRVLLGAPAGFVVLEVGWVWYYVIATALAVPGLALLWWLWSREKPQHVQAASQTPG
jgi:MFS transporter, PAT family, beta-lactamase induction signal transducer AmpG